MPERDKAAAIAREWMSKAEEAVKLARRVRREVRKMLEDKPLF
ncbi:MAG: hypothetical protein NTZ17_10220 [Phycisphaerae bacterium]|nr:hypothetical protein [Phycisphaerae bacterium]